jgi:peptidylprolyl isomerase
MQTMRKFLANIFKKCLKISFIAFLCSFLSLSLSVAEGQAETPKPLLISALAQGNAITDPNAILRYALPIDNDTIRKLQDPLEDISNYLRGKRWPPIAKDVKSAKYILTLQSDKILASIPDDRKAKAESLLTTITDQVTELQEAVEAKDKDKVAELRIIALSHVGALEELMVQGFPYEVPEEYANLPQLKGRAKVKLETTQGPLAIVVDGYSAPVSAGNFVDLVQRGFYNGLPFSGTEGNFVLQTGDPIGPEAGFIDPKTKEYRAIPLEILVKGEELPFYGTTLEELGLYLPELALPFNAYGAVALARPDTEANGGSSQFFFFKFDNELTPPGFNLMDGRYSVFGYLVEGKDTLDKLTDKDKIISAKVVEGAENLVEPQNS